MGHIGILASRIRRNGLHIGCAIGKRDASHATLLFDIHHIQLRRYAIGRRCHLGHIVSHQNHTLVIQREHIHRLTTHSHTAHGLARRGVYLPQLIAKALSDPQRATLWAIHHRRGVCSARILLLDGQLLGINLIEPATAALTSEPQLSISTLRKVGHSTCQFQLLLYPLAIR